MNQSRLVVVPAAEWAATAAEQIGAQIRKALLTSPGARCAIALAGGTTPGPVYSELAARFRTRLDWPRVDLFLSDERLVPMDDPASNYRTAREALLALPSDCAPRIHAAPTDWQPEHAAAAYELAIRERVRAGPDGIPAFDLILLGVGNDGHTASLFPGAAVLSEKTRLVAATSHPQSGQARLTFTLPLIAAAREVVFLVCGKGKAEILQRVYGTSASADLPVTLAAAAAQDSVWIVDGPAAARLQTR